jgi:hypothetical protein
MPLPKMMAVDVVSSSAPAVDGSCTAGDVPRVLLLLLLLFLGLAVLAGHVAAAVMWINLWPWFETSCL